MVIKNLIHPKPWVYYSTVPIPTRPIKPFIPFKLNHTVGTIPAYLAKIRQRIPASPDQGQEQEQSQEQQISE